ncbi:hypothetical protein B0H19DRAFT_1080764 [Mycena capillaripes]|nr:hypothetical protein B0H19DRAFT_1080764 [Mycena capillaripes]
MLGIFLGVKMAPAFLDICCLAWSGQPGQANLSSKLCGATAADIFESLARCGALWSTFAVQPGQANLSIPDTVWSAMLGNFLGVRLAVTFLDIWWRQSFSRGLCLLVLLSSPVSRLDPYSISLMQAEDGSIRFDAENERERRRKLQRLRRSSEDESVHEFRRKKNSSARKVARGSLDDNQQEDIRNRNTTARRGARRNLDEGQRSQIR